jgi:hypothetical protein
MTIDNGANAGASKLDVRHKSSRFSHSLRIRCPATPILAVDQAAERGLTTSSEYIRRAVIDHLKADGLGTPATLNTCGDGRDGFVWGWDSFSGKLELRPPKILYGPSTRLNHCKLPGIFSMMRSLRRLLFGLFIAGLPRLSWLRA